MTPQEVLEYIIENVPVFEEAEIIGEGVAFHYTSHADKIEDAQGFLGVGLGPEIERTASHEHLALLNASGSPLWADGHIPEGKYWKNDNIRNAYERLQKKTGIGKPLKSLKKTSASLIRGNGEFTGLESLFLGHAPQSMADRHYAAIPQDLLDRAINWLREQYRLPEMADALKLRDRKPPKRSKPKCV